MVDSIRKSQIEAEILELCDQTLSPLGYRTIDLDFRASGRSMIRLFIERIKEDVPDAPKGVSIEDCATASRALGPVLDEKVASAYDLEVSSPGIDRRLRLKGDFEKVVGQELKLKLAERLPGRGANLTGRLARVDKDEIFVIVDRDEVAVPLGQVLQAVRVWREPPPAKN